MNSRRKGRRAESAFARLLADRGHEVIDTTAGKTCCDLASADTDNVRWAWEVKDRKLADWAAFMAQARANAGRSRWGLAVHIPQSSSWLVIRQGCEPTVWR